MRVLRNHARNNFSAMASLDVIITELLFTVVNNHCTVDNVWDNERKVVF